MKFHIKYETDFKTLIYGDIHKSIWIMRLWYLQCVKNIMSLQNMSNHFFLNYFVLRFCPIWSRYFGMIKYFQSSVKGIIWYFNGTAWLTNMYWLKNINQLDNFLYENTAVCLQILQKFKIYVRSFCSITWVNTSTDTRTLKIIILHLLFQ